MTKDYVTQAEVSAAADALVARGEEPTQKKVRAECGERGSMATIGKYLGVWRAEKQGEATLLEAELSADLKAKAELFVVSVQADLRGQFDLEAKRQAADARRREAELNTALENACEEADALTVERDAAKSRIAVLEAQIAAADSKVAEATARMSGLDVQSKTQEGIIAALHKTIVALAPSADHALVETKPVEAKNSVSNPKSA